MIGHRTVRIVDMALIPSQYESLQKFDYASFNFRRKHERSIQKPSIQI
jgi:hypothetical protein